MRIVFLYNRSADDPAQKAEDEVPSHSPVVAALKRLGHKVVPIACSLDLARLRQRLLRARPDVVFNRVESLGGSDSMMAAITLLLDAMELPYTGNSTAALVGTASKVAVKERLVEAGLPTPGWIVGQWGVGNWEGGISDASHPLHSGRILPKYIIKSDLEHASFELDGTSIVAGSHIAEIRDLIRQREEQTGRVHFAEEFVDGREFNISVMCDPPRVLPPAEIDFSAFPQNMPRIVSHQAKWDVESFEYDNTERLFAFPLSDAPVLRRLIELTETCWQLFGLTGYARVDFRCDVQGQPWILEINTNPCISPDAGFAAALEEAGLGYDGGLQLILDDALARGRKGSNSAIEVGRHQAANAAR